MDMEHMIKHMNDEHREQVIAFCKKFAQEKDIHNATVVGIDFGGLDIVYNDTVPFRFEFPEKATPETLKKSIISLFTGLKESANVEAVQQQLKEFMESFGSIILASVDAQGMPVCSYAPLIHYNNNYYIYISEVAEHFNSISKNPTKLEVMFLEDESKAKSVILRRRARFKSKAIEIERESAEFTSAIKSLEDRMEGFGGIKTINKMKDFHLFKLEFINGRFVIGFGGAYDVDSAGNVTYIGGTGNPHTMK